MEGPRLGFTKDSSLSTTAKKSSWKTFSEFSNGSIRDGKNLCAKRDGEIQLRYYSCFTPSAASISKLWRDWTERIIEAILNIKALRFSTDRRRTFQPAFTLANFLGKRYPVIWEIMIEPLNNAHMHRNSISFHTGSKGKKRIALFMRIV